MIAFLKRWIITTVAVLVAAWLIPGIDYDSAEGLIIATLILGFLNAVVRPVLIVLSLPLLLVTLGLFFLVINALLLYGVGQVMSTFHVRSFGSALLGSIIISVVTLILNSLTKSGNSRIEIRKGRGPSHSDEDGPVIDV